MSNYVLVGAGGTGSHLFRPLCMYLDAYEQDRDPEWLIHVWDGDHVENNNLARQIFEPSEIQMNKARALAGRMDARHVQAHDQFLSPDSIQAGIQDGDIVIIAADNFFVRKLIEDHARTLDNVTIINGGNEDISGSVQIYVRAEGKDITPRLSHLHPEITNAHDHDRSQLSCAQIAELPGGEQTILANLTSATLILAAIWRHHQELTTKPNPDNHGYIPWTEIQFDHREGTFVPWDVRTTRNWSSTPA